MRTARERGWAAEVVKVEMTGARELVRLDQVLRVQARDSAAIRQIGRASCRERVSR